MKETRETYGGSVAGGWTEDWAAGEGEGRGGVVILVGLQDGGGTDAVASQSQQQQQLWPSSSGCC